MASHQTFEILGFSFTFCYAVNSWFGTKEEEFVGVFPSEILADDFNKELFLEALEIASQWQQIYMDYAYCNHRNETFNPTRPYFVKGYVKETQYFVDTLIEQSQVKSSNTTYTPITTPRKVTGYVYLVQAVMPQNYYKIGCSTNPVERIETLGVRLPFPITPIHQFKVNDMFGIERRLHDKYADKRANGEWFALTDNDVAEICAIESMNEVLS